MFKLVLTNVFRRPLRSLLTTTGIGIAVAALLLIDQVSSQYRAQLLKELNAMGIHMMLVPLGCPYDAASRVLKGGALETSLPQEALAVARADHAVAVAAPLLIAAVPRHEQGRTDMFVGLDESALPLKPWWKPKSGALRFPAENSIILGADAADLELRQVGDPLYSPETKTRFNVTGILTHSGTSDDSMFFVPLATAQKMFQSEGRITAVAIRLRDPSELSAVSSRLQTISGAQVVTQTEMMGTFLNILGAVRTLLQSVGWVALAASAAGLVNTLLMSVAERRFEFSLFRALGASRFQVLCVVAIESLLLTGAGLLIGAMAVAAIGSTAVSLLDRWLPFNARMLAPALTTSLPVAALLAVVLALVASILPAWRAAQAEPADVLKGAD